MKAVLALIAICFIMVSCAKELPKQQVVIPEVTYDQPSDPPIGDLIWWNRPGSSVCQCLQWQVNGSGGKGYQVVDDWLCYQAGKPLPPACQAN